MDGDDVVTSSTATEERRRTRTRTRTRRMGDSGQERECQRMGERETGARMGRSMAAADRGRKLVSMLLLGFIAACSSQGTCKTSTVNMVGACAGRAIAVQSCYSASQSGSDACAGSLVGYSSTVLTAAKCSDFLDAKCRAAGGSVKSSPSCSFMCEGVPSTVSCGQTQVTQNGQTTTTPCGATGCEAAACALKSPINYTHASSGAVCPFPTSVLPTNKYEKLCCIDLQRAIEAGCSGIECGLLYNYMKGMRESGGCVDYKAGDPNACTQTAGSVAGACEQQDAKKGSKCMTGNYVMTGLCGGTEFKSRDCYSSQTNAAQCMEAAGKYLDSVMDPGLSADSSACARLMPPLCETVGGAVKQAISCDFWCTAISTMSNTSSSCFDDSDCAAVETQEFSTLSAPKVTCPKAALPTRLVAGSDNLGGLSLNGFCCESIRDIIETNCEKISESKLATYIEGLRSKSTELGGCISDNKRCMDTVKSPLQCLQARTKLEAKSVSCSGTGAAPVLNLRGCFRDQQTADTCSSLGKDLLASSSSSSCLPTVEKMCTAMGGRSISGHSCDFMCDAIRGGVATDCINNQQCKESITDSVKIFDRCPSPSIGLSGLCCSYIESLATSLCYDIKCDKLQSYLDNLRKLGALNGGCDNSGASCVKLSPITDYTQLYAPGTLLYDLDKSARDYALCISPAGQACTSASVALRGMCLSQRPTLKHQGCSSTQARAESCLSKLGDDLDDVNNGFSLNKCKSFYFGICRAADGTPKCSLDCTLMSDCQVRAPERGDCGTWGGRQCPSTPASEVPGIMCCDTFRNMINANCQNVDKKATDDFLAAMRDPASKKLSLPACRDNDCIYWQGSAPARLKGGGGGVYLLAAVTAAASAMLYGFSR